MKKLLTIVGVLALALVLFTSTAWATPITPGDNGNGATNPSRMAQMFQWMGPENWGHRVQRMTQIHGAEETGRMLQWMNQSAGCHIFDSTGSMMERGFGRGMGSALQGGMWNGSVDA